MGDGSELESAAEERASPFTADLAAIGEALARLARGEDTDLSPFVTDLCVSADLGACKGEFHCHVVALDGNGRVRVRVPEEIVHRNPGISPLALDALLAYFEGSEGDIESLIPAAPASEDAVESYVAIFGRIQKTLGGKLAPVPGRGYMLAILVAEWMRGYPLARLIESRIKYNNKLPNQKSLGAVIRSVLEDVEQIARFEAPRALTAYKDVLTFYLTSTNRAELAESIPDVGLLLEFGASQGTQISLMSIGLSRTAAIELSELLIRDDLSKADVLEWLRGRSWQQHEVSPIIVREIEKVLSYENGAGTD